MGKGCSDGAGRIADRAIIDQVDTGLKTAAQEGIGGIADQQSTLGSQDQHFLTLLAITYLSARRGKEGSHFRQALVWAGGLALLPTSALLAAGEWAWYPVQHPPISLPLHIVGLLVAFVLPLLVAWFLRGKAAVWNLGFALNVLIFISPLAWR